MREFSFEQQLDMSAGVDVSKDMRAVMKDRVPGATDVVKASKRSDRNGTDYWVQRGKNSPLSIDCKVRGIDPVEKYGVDDLALETWSDVDARKIGWSLDETKRTDFILWWFSPTHRWCLVPFPQLLYSFRKRATEWWHQFRHEQQPSRGLDGHSWRSECLFVPRREIWAAIYRDFSGDPRWS